MVNRSEIRNISTLLQLYKSSENLVWIKVSDRNIDLWNPQSLVVYTK